MDCQRKHLSKNAWFAKTSLKNQSCTSNIYLLLWVPSRLFQCSASCLIPCILPCWADLLPHSIHWPVFHCSACSFRKVQLSNLRICNMVHVHHWLAIMLGVNTPPLHIPWPISSCFSAANQSTAKDSIVFRIIQCMLHELIEGLACGRVYHPVCTLQHKRINRIEIMKNVSLYCIT